MYGAYYWYTHMETPKDAFFKYIGQTNIPEILDTEIYYNILEKINQESFETSTSANFTTTKKTDFTENVDVSKFEFTLDTKSNKVEEEAFIDAKVKYLDNDFFDFKYIGTKYNMAIGSSEIFEKYIATSKANLSSSLNRTVGVETDINADSANKKMNEFIDNRVNLEADYKLQKSNEYMSVLLEKVPDNAVELVEASPITINKQVINTDAYVLTLDANSYNTLIKDIFTKLQNDTEFLNKLVTGVPAEEKAVEEEPVDEGSPKPLTIESIEGQTLEHETEQEVEPEAVQLDDLSEEPVENDLQSEDGNITDEVNPNEELTQNFTSLFANNEETEKEPKEEQSIFVQLIGAILFNQKLDMSVEQLQNKISQEVANINSTEGIKVTVYVRNEEGQEQKTIKILAELPETATLDIEYPSDSKAKITFLEDVKEKNEEGQEIVIEDKGNSIEIERTSADVQTKFNFLINYIEQKRVVKKTQIDLTTQGTKSSKTYSNDAIIKYNDSEGDYKINIKNTIDFKNVNVEEELNDENTIFIDRLSDEEATNLFANVITNAMSVYSEKILNMNFINTNAPDGVIQQPGTEDTEPEPLVTSREPAEQTDNPVNIGGNSSEEEALISKEEAKNLLIGKIEAMMAEAENAGAEFTIQNLSGLPDQLQGHNLSSIIEETRAKISIAGYTFYIDQDFMLTEE